MNKRYAAGLLGCWLAAGSMAAAAPAGMVPEAGENVLPAQLTHTAETAGTDAGMRLAATAGQDAPAAQPATEGDEDAERQERPWEIQMEYLDGRWFSHRRIDRYNVHWLELARRRGSVSIYRGLTFSRMTGYTTDNGIWRDSNAWGLGPTLMIRWEKRISGKLYGDLEASGTLEIYNRAHPARGRAYGFLWRVGPRLSYRFTERDAMSVGYMIHHSSNGMGSHNPGYHGAGVSLGYRHGF